MRLTLDLKSVDDYRLFLRVKSLPRYAFCGREAIIPDEYASLIGVKPKVKKLSGYEPMASLFDYQKGVSSIAIRKRKFAAFIACGLGKTLIGAEFIRHAAQAIKRKQCALWISPLMVIKQTLSEFKRFYGDSLPVVQVKSGDLGEWLRSGTEKIGITNWEALTDDVEAGRLGAIVGDETSTMKSHYGKWGTNLIRLGKGIDWKLAMTGTPAPNDRIEFANHAVFLDAYPTVNSFLARFFVNRGQTNERWELKPHALKPFYRELSHWCIFVENPATYGWKDNTRELPPIEVAIHDIDMTEEQTALAYSKTGTLFAMNVGGITSRSVLSQIGKGSYKGEDIDSRKPAFIRNLVESWTADEQTIVWCIYNNEQDTLAREMPDAASIDGDTPHDERERIIDAFKAGKVRTIISKSKVMGFGLNLQNCTRMVFSGLQDSWEMYHQCVKRANRVGSTRPLRVHIPVVDCEREMVDNVIRKAHRVDQDTAEQERIFKESGYAVG